MSEVEKAHAQALRFRQSGFVAYQQQNYTEAIAAFRQAAADYDQLIKDTRDATARHALRQERAKTRMNLGVALQAALELAEAIAAYTDAIADYDQLIENTADAIAQRALRQWRADTHMNRGVALYQAGQIKDAISAIERADADYTALIDETADAAAQRALRQSRADTRLNRGAAFYAAGQGDAAISAFANAEADYTALIDETPDAVAHRPLRAKRATTRRNRGMTLGRAGQLSDAISALECAEADYTTLIDETADAVVQRPLRQSRADTRRFRGLALRHAGQLDAAIGVYPNVEAEFTALIDDTPDAAAQRPLRQLRADTRRFWGTALNQAGQFDAASSVYANAEADYTALINETPDAAVERWLRESRADTHSGRGSALDQAGQFDAAIRVYANAEADYTALIDETQDADAQRGLRQSRAETRMNCGVVLHQARQLDAAIRVYLNAEAEFTALIDETLDAAAQRRSRQGRAYTYLNLGQALRSARNQVARRRATEFIEAALGEYASLAFETASSYFLLWQHSLLDTWFLAWQCTATLPNTPWPWTDERKPVATGAEMLQALSDAADVCKQVAGDVTTDAKRDRFFRPGVVNLLGLMRRVSLELAPNDADCPLVTDAQTLLFEAIELADDPLALAQWLVHSRAIRSQVLALTHLAQHPDVRVQEYTVAYKKRGEIDQLIAGLAAPTGRQGTDDFGWHPLSAEAQREVAQAREAVLAKLRADREKVTSEINSLRRIFIEQDLLPPDTSPTLQQLLKQTQGKVVLVLLRNPREPDVVMPMLLHDGKARFLAGAARTLDLPPAVLDTSGIGRGTMRDGGVLSANAQPASEEVKVFGDSLASAMKTLREGLTEAGVALDTVGTELLLVPQDDLHKVAWRDVFRQHLKTAVTVLPSLPALERRLKGLKSPLRPRWASLAFDAAGTPHTHLRWVPVEQDLSARLWGDNLHKLDKPAWPATEQQSTVSAVMGAGHGHLQQNVATAGMLIAARAALDGTLHESYFTARDLRNIHQADRMWLSVCLLAQTHEKCGEPLGMLAQAMGEHGVDWAAGSLTPIDDTAAALFSLLFQWRLREAYDAAENVVNEVVDWTHVFDAAKGDVHSGQWPEKFAAWLRAELPGALERAIAGEITAASDMRAKNQAFIDWRKALNTMPFPPLNELPRFLSDKAWAREQLVVIASQYASTVPEALIKAADTLVSFG